MDIVTESRASPRQDGPAAAFLPPETPTAMSAQPLRGSAPRLLGGAAGAAMWPRRIVILAGTALMTAVGYDEIYDVLKVGGVTPLEWFVLVLFVALFAWIAFSFMSAMAGFVVLLFRRKDALGIDPAAA